MASDPKLLQQFMGTNEYIGATDPKMRELYLQRFQALPEAEQQALVKGLTPAKDPSAGYRPPGVPSVQQETLEEGITAPSTLVPLAMGAVSVPAAAALPMAARAVTRPVVEGGMQAMGELGGQYMETGKVPSLGDVTSSILMNMLPSAGEEAVRGALRTGARASRGGQVIQADEAAQRARGMGERVFEPEAEPVLSAMFNRVRTSRVKLDIGNVQTYLGSLTPDEQHLLLREVGKINLPFSKALGASGTAGSPSIRGWDIGELQDLRSELIQATQRTKTPQVQDMLTQLRGEVDDAIGHATAVGSVPDAGTSALLKEAQAGWRRLRSSEELETMVGRHIDPSPDLRYQDLKLNALAKEFDAPTRAGERMTRQMGTAERERLRAELAELAELYPSVRIAGQVGSGITAASLVGATGMALSGHPGAAAATLLPGVISAVMMSPRAMGIFRQAIIHGRGEISPNTVALIASAARREMQDRPADRPADRPRTPVGG